MSDFELLLIRHGVAQDWAAGGDSERALTPEGTQQILRSVAGLRALDLRIDAAIASPFVRAQQTAQAHLQVLGGQLETWAGLVPSAPASATVDELLSRGKVLRDGARLAVFGHNPNISEVASLLVAGHSAAMFNVRQGDVIHLLIPAVPFGRASVAPKAVLLAFYPREALELLGAQSVGPAELV